ncbi:MAG: hypothetical protein E7496_12675 [Ruminococcus sp.]|nr:hypothetical protein [Ruminococcus sp.]
MIQIRDSRGNYHETLAIYDNAGREIKEVRNNQGRIIFKNWNELQSSPPITFRGYGKNLTECRIYGNTVQNGTPSPQAPVDVVGCGVRTGNLFDKSATNTNNGYISDGYLKSDGSKNTNGDYRASEYIAVSPNQSYTLWYGSNLNAPSVCFYDVSKNFISGIAYEGRSTIPLTTPQNTAFLRVSFWARSVNIVMLNTGSAPLPYEPYGYKLPLTVNGTEYPIYLGQVETRRRIKKYVFTGEENGTIYSTSTSRKGIEITGITGIIGGDADIAILAICTHYQPDTRNALYRNTDNGISNAYQNDKIIFYDASCQTVEAFQQFCTQQYANGTPVTVWYVLAEPETGIVNEPLQKIGDYSDELSIADIPTINGINTISADTIVQPSEMYIKGKIKSIT